MDEPVGFWVRQVATDGAVIAVKAIPGQQTVQLDSTNADPLAGDEPEGVSEPEAV